MFGVSNTFLNHDDDGHADDDDIFDGADANNHNHDTGTDNEDGHSEYRLGFLDLKLHPISTTLMPRWIIW